jgi:hypothetical protein
MLATVTVIGYCTTFSIFGLLRGFHCNQSLWHLKNKFGCMFSCWSAFVAFLRYVLAAKHVSLCLSDQHSRPLSYSTNARLQLFEPVAAFLCIALDTHNLLLVALGGLFHRQHGERRQQRRVPG